MNSLSRISQIASRVSRVPIVISHARPQLTKALFEPQTVKLWTPLVIPQKRFFGATSKLLSESTEKLQSDETAISSFRVSSETQHILKSKGITHLFPIQYETFDYVFDGTDIIARARTGTGKTLAFALPIVEKLKTLPEIRRSRLPKVIVLAPTRELAKQVAEEFATIAPTLRTTCIYGGAPMGHQEDALRSGVDVVIGTPGRIIDHLGRGTLDLSQVKFAVLDEADEMLNIGFADDIEEILAKVTSKHQTCLFSATIPPWVRDVAGKYLSDNHQVVDLVGDEKVKSSENIKHYVLQVSESERAAVISSLVAQYGTTGKVLIFTETKTQANQLGSSPFLAPISQVLHGDVAQSRREAVMRGFREDRIKALIATDVAARGLDIPDVDLVIQISPPRMSETYIHRVGRTARAGRSGTAITLISNSMEGDIMSDYQRKVGTTFARLEKPKISQSSEAFFTVYKERMLKLRPHVIDNFTPLSQKLAEEFGAERAMSMLLALFSGYDSQVGSTPGQRNGRGSRGDRDGDRRGSRGGFFQREGRDGSRRDSRGRGDRGDRRDRRERDDRFGGRNFSSSKPSPRWGEKKQTNWQPSSEDW